MGVTEVIAKGFSVANKSKGLVLILFVVGFVWNLINMPFSAQVQSGNQAATVTVGLLSLVFLLVNIFLQSGTLGFVHDVIKTGQSTIGRFQQCATKYYLRMLGLSVLVGLFVIIAGIIGALVVLAGGDNLNPLSVAGTLVIFAVALVGILFVFFAPYSIVADDAKVVDALRTSIQLVKAHFLKALMIGITFVLMAIGIGLVVGALFGMIGALVKGQAGQAIFGAISSLVNAYLGIVVAGSFMSFYLAIKTSDTPASTA